ncbi:hypothetical protein ES703_31244 [subsurface metagenome]
MAKKNARKLFDWLVWIASTIVGLGVGFAAIKSTLVVPFIPAGVMTFFGWVVVITTIWASVWKIIDLLR